MDFAAITRCFELTEDAIADAAESRDGTRALLEHMARVSSPDSGAAKVLLLLARLATTAASEWMDGDLYVEIIGDGQITAIELTSDLGGGMRERLFQPVRFKAPLDEFTRAIDRVPHMLNPLAVSMKSSARVTLSVMEAVRRSTKPPPWIKIADDSVFVIPKAPVPPREIEERPIALPLISPGLPRVITEAKAPRKQRSARPPVHDPRAEPDDDDVDSGWDDS
jgi:hypothetical protein